MDEQSKPAIATSSYETAVQPTISSLSTSTLNPHAASTDVLSEYFNQAANPVFPTASVPQVSSSKDLFGSVAVIVDETGSVKPRSESLESRSRSNTPRPAAGANVSERVQVGLLSTAPQQVMSATSWSHFGPAAVLPSAGGFQDIAMKDLVGEENNDVSGAIRSAWIPGERTSGALQAISASIPASDFLGSDQLTKPGILSDRLFVNPAFELALKFVGTIPPSLIPDNADEMLNRGDIRGLLEKGFYSSAANLAGKMLYSFGQGFGTVGTVSGHSAESLLIWYYRAAALVLLEKAELASKELEAFGDLDNPDLYFEYYSSTAAPLAFGSMIPFQLRLLHARLPQMLGSSRVTLDRLYGIRDKIEKMLNDASEGKLPVGVPPQEVVTFQDFWQQRRISVLHHIVSAAVQSEDFDTAISLMGTIMKLVPEKSPSMLRCLGLLYCHIGTARMAGACFQMYEETLRPESQDLTVAQLTHRALLTICEEPVPQSLEVYSNLLALQPKNTSFANGMAIGYFYSGRMAEAIVLLENLVLSQPRIFLTVQSITNLVAILLRLPPFAKQMVSDIQQALWCVRDPTATKARPRGILYVPLELVGVPSSVRQTAFSNGVAFVATGSDNSTPGLTIRLSSIFELENSISGSPDERCMSFAWHEYFARTKTRTVTFVMLS